jgi:hypothetical protein
MVRPDDYEAGPRYLVLAEARAIEQKLAELRLE